MLKSKFIGKRKAQITLFIIIGVVLLLGVGFLWINRAIFLKEAPVEIEKIQTSTQLEKAARNYVESCLKPIVLNGLEIIRLQGGYIDIPSGIEYKVIKDPNSEYVKEEGNTKKVVIDENALGNMVPFWVTKNSVTMPSLEFIKAQLENYITRELKICINNFEPFKEQAYDVVQGDITTNVTFGDSVVVDVSLPATFKKGQIQTYIEKYTSSVPINIPLVQSISITLALSEYVLAYLEFNTNNLWGLYSGVKQDLLPPLRDERVNTDGSFVTWEKGSVESFFKNVVAKNIQDIKIIGTQYTSGSGIYKSFEYNLLINQSYPDIIITHVYSPDWGLYNFDVKPSPIKPSMFEELDIPLLPSFYVFKYKFYYYAEYSALVEVQDTKSAKIYTPSGLYGEDMGYKFQFLDYVAIYGNQPRQYVANSFAPSAGEDIYENAGVNTTALREAGVNILPESYFCDEEQKLSGNITINVYDSKTASGLGDVNVYYRCGSYKNDCYVGRTNPNGSIVSKMPLCQNGQLRLSKTDYNTKKETLTISQVNETKTLTYNLVPFFKANATIKKYKMTKPNELGTIMNLEPGDRIILNVKKEGTSDFDTVSNNMLIFGAEAQQNEVKLSPGNYELSGTLMTKGFTIPARCAKICTSFSDDSCTAYSYIPESDISLGNISALGGIQIDSSNGYWQITDDMLQGSQITFYVIQAPQPTCIIAANETYQECLVGTCIPADEMGKTAEYSTMFKQQLLPRFG